MLGEDLFSRLDYFVVHLISSSNVRFCIDHACTSSLGVLHEGILSSLVCSSLLRQNNEVLLVLVQLAIEFKLLDCGLRVRPTIDDHLEELDELLGDKRVEVPKL